MITTIQAEINTNPPTDDHLTPTMQPFTQGIPDTSLTPSSPFV
jgi:hypothetical protein